MTVAQMKYFIEVAKCLSFSEAAMRLYLSQPALSRQISAMESELNAQLFIRSRNTVHLTPAGQVLLDGLQKLYADYQALVSQVDMINAGSTGQLKIGILEYQRLPLVVSDTLDQMMHTHPEVKICLSTGSFHQLKEQLYDGELDLATTLALSVDSDSQLASMVFERRPLFLVVQKNHPHAAIDQITKQDIRRLFSRDRFLVMSPQDSPQAANSLLEDFRSLEMYPDIEYAHTAGQMALWLMAGRGITVINDEHVLFHDPSLHFIRINNIRPTDIAIVWNRATSNPVIPLFIQMLEQRAQIERSEEKLPDHNAYGAGNDDSND